MSFRDVLRIRSFRDLWLGQAISQLGDSIYYVAFMYMAQKMTGSFAMVGYVGAMEMLPYVLFGSYSGVLADRLDRKRIMLWSDLFSCSALLLFAVLVVANAGKAPAWSLLVIPFALSSVRCFFMPAKSAAIPNLVPSELLTQANALSSTTFNFVGLAGLGVAATAIAPLYLISPRNFFTALLLLNALSFAGSAVFVSRLPALKPDRKEEKHPWEDFKSGVRYLRGRHDLSVLVVLLTVFRLGVAPFFVAYVAANDKWFGGRPSTLMWMEFAFFVGMISGGLLVARVKVRRPTVTFSIELALVGIFVALMAIPQFYAFVAFNFLCGIVVAGGDIPITTYLQLSVEDSYRGRVNSVKDMITISVMPIGMALGGFMLRSFGLVGSFFLMAGVMTAAGLAGFLDKRYREVRMPEEAFSDATKAIGAMDAIEDARSKIQDQVIA